MTPLRPNFQAPPVEHKIAASIVQYDALIGFRDEDYFANIVLLETEEGTAEAGITG